MTQVRAKFKYDFHWKSNRL